VLVERCVVGEMAISANHHHCYPLPHPLIRFHQTSPTHRLSDPSRLQRVAPSVPLNGQSNPSHSLVTIDTRPILQTKTHPLSTMMSGSQEEPPQPSSFLTSASPHNAPVAVHISFPTGTSFTISLMDKATSRLHVGKYSLDNDPTMAHDKFESIKLCVASAAADFRAEQVQTQLEQTTAPDPPSSQSQSQPPLLTQQPLLSLTQSTPAPPDTAQTFSLFTVSSQNITFIVKQQQKTFTKTLLTLPLYACGADKVGLFVENIILNWSSENERNRALTLSNASLVTAAQDWQDATTKLSTQLQLRENELVTNFVVVLNEKKAETDKLRAQLEAEKKKKGTGGGEGEGEDIGGSTDVADVRARAKRVETG